MKLKKCLVILPLLALTLSGCDEIASLGQDDSSSEQTTESEESGENEETGGGQEDPDSGSDIDDETIIAAILSSLNDISYLDEEWEASHVSDDGTDYYVTSEDDTYLYGKYESGDDYGYYKGGMLYEYKDGEYTSNSYSNGYDDFLGNYSDPLDIADELEDEYSEYAKLSKDNEGNYVLTYDLTQEDDAIYTYVANSEYEIIKLGYVDETYDDNYTVAQYSTEDLETKMASFDESLWNQQVWESGDTITLYFTFTYNGSVETLEDYEQIYIIGAWNGGSWVNDEAKPLTLGEDGQTYYAEFTYQTDEDVVTESHWFTFNLFIASTSESYSWSAERQLLSEDGVWTWENGLLSASWEVELTKPFADYIEDPSSITTRTDCTVTYYFVDNAETPTEYYSIPSYADAYVTGYITSTTTWTDYTIGGNTKLSAVSTSASDGYSVTFGTIHTGTVTYNMYFEYNSSAVNHTAASSASWSAAHAICSDTNNNTTMYIPTTGDCNVYIAINPGELITDEASTASCTIAVYDSANASTDRTLYCSGTMNSWNNSNKMTYDASGTDYQYSYTFTPDANTQYEFGIFHISSWADSIQFSTTTSEYWNNGNDLVISSSVIGTYANTLIILTVDGSNFNTSSHVMVTNVTITH